MDFEKTLIYQFAQVSTAQRVSLDKALENAGLFGGQIFVLFALWERDGQSQAEIAERLNVSAPAVNKMVRSLSEADLVTTERSSADARITAVRLTDFGRKIRETVELLWQEAESRFAEPLSPAERLMLAEILGKIRASQLSAPPEQD
jgi:DNA-binding MarR family transcriptional regulator